jgi:hypothetical protein
MDFLRMTLTIVYVTGDRLGFIGVVQAAVVDRLS